MTIKAVFTFVDNHKVNQSVYEYPKTVIGIIKNKIRPSTVYVYMSDPKLDRNVNNKDNVKEWINMCSNNIRDNINENIKIDLNIKEFLKEDEYKNMNDNSIMRFFEYDHLPEQLQKISAPICDLAQELNRNMPESDEKEAGLRKLLEAKDCMVRASLSN